MKAKHYIYFNWSVACCMRNLEKCSQFKMYWLICVQLIYEPTGKSISPFINLINIDNEGEPKVDFSTSFRMFATHFQAFDKFFVDFSSIAHCLVAINSQDSKLKWLRRLTIHSNLTQVIFFRFGMVPFLWIRHHPSGANISSTLSLMFLAMLKMGKRNENSADKWFRFTVSPFFDHHHPSW